MEYRWLYDERSAPGVDYNDAEVAEKYDETHSSLYDPLQAACATLEQITLGKNDVLIDLATGTGTLAIEAAQRCKKVYAVDISPAMLNQARRKAEISDISNIEFIEAGFLSYEHQGDNPDVIVSLIALHHLPDFWKAVAIQKVYDLLKPGGTFLFADSAYSFHPREYQNVYNAVMTERKAQVSKRLFDQMLNDSSTEFMTFTWILEGIFKRVGFTVETAEYPSELFANYVCRK
ncbi:class I SAM-dependent methyltransferase [Planctomycetota bacterium]